MFEEDTAEGAVYRPEEHDIPLSRRPRERLALAPDGSATVFLPGADDRLVDWPATWHEHGGGIAIRTSFGTELRIVECAADRLLVRTRDSGTDRNADAR